MICLGGFLDRHDPYAPPANGRLLVDVVEGDCTLSIRADAAEESCRIVEPILDSWWQGLVAPLEYLTGSEGANAARNPPEE